MDDFSSNQGELLFLERASPFQPNLSDSEIERVILIYIAAEPCRFGQYYGAQVSSIAILGKERCPYIVGDDMRGISEKNG